MKNVSFSKVLFGAAILAFTGSATLSYAGAPIVDSDNDGVSNTIENMAINSGDGNGDGIKDRDQGNVVSMIGQDGRIVTVVAPAGTQLSEMNFTPNNALPPTLLPGLSLPEGIIGFTLTGVTPGASASVTLIYHSTPNTFSNYYKYDAVNQTYVQMPSGDTAFFFNIININILDGGPFDSDGVANGEIVDPGGPGDISLEVVLTSFSSSSDESGNVTVSWSTAQELGTAGFTVYEVAEDNGAMVRGNAVSGFIVAEGGEAAGANYSIVDPTPLAEGETRRYLLVELENDGDEIQYGPSGASFSSSNGTTTNVENWAIFE